MKYEVNSPLIALCGHPGSGKSEVQRILFENFGIVSFDDGDIGRRHCMELFGLSREQVTTQSGKKEVVRIQGRDWEVRKILGEYLAALEALFGPYTVPIWAVAQARSEIADFGRSNQRHPGFSFGSVRRDQGKVYRDAGGYVVEIKRKGAEPSGNEWDLYNLEHVTHSFSNDSISIESLERDVVTFFGCLLDRQPGHHKQAA